MTQRKTHVTGAEASIKAQTALDAAFVLAKKREDIDSMLNVAAAWIQIAASEDEKAQQHHAPKSTLGFSVSED